MELATTRAHARRKFDEALQTLPKEKRQESLAAAGECYCTRLFQLEQSLMDLTPEERYTKRLELEKPVLDALLAWANEASAKTAPKSALGKALHYLREQWPYLVRYLEDGRLELSNNRAERSPLSCRATCRTCLLRFSPTASRNFYSVRYICLPDLMVEISMAQANGTYRDYMTHEKTQEREVAHPG